MKQRTKSLILVFAFLFIFFIGNETVNAAKSEIDDSGIETAFPDSYKPYLRELQRLHPNWKFIAVNTNLRWSDCIAAESEGTKSLVPASYSSAWKESDNQIEAGWVPASDSAIGYAMDPRNFLTESAIFQFETTKYNSKVHTPTAVSKILSGTPMGEGDLVTKYKKAGQWYNLTEDGKTTYSDIIVNSGKNYNLSPVHLASRIVQETGGDIINNKSIYGSYPGLEGYYNFFNIGAYGDNPVRNGLLRAKESGWDTPQKSIDAAASKIYNDYTKWGQYTVYFEKWDVNDPSGNNNLFWMQYMTNILAPSSEANRIYNAYKKANMLDSEFIFYIPVYLNMPTSPVKVGEETDYEEDYTKVYLDDTSDTGVNDVFKIYAEPNSSSQVVYTLTETAEGASNRTKMTRILKGISSQWDKVRLDNGIEGYVFSKYVVVYENYVKVTSLSLDKTNVNLKTGEQLKLNANITPSNAEFKKIHYKCEDEGVAYVDENGVITARNIGTTRVIATSDDNPNIKAICTVNVDYTTSQTFTVGEEFVFENNNPDAKFYTNNSEILEVEESGKVIARYLGDATIFVKNSYNIVLKTIYVKVNYTDSKSIGIGESFKLSNSYNTCYTNNNEVLNVSGNGTVTGKWLGDATVFTKDANGKVNSMTYVKVNYSKSYTLKPGDNLVLNIDNAVTYYTNNNEVLNVSNNGKVRASWIGEASIFAKDKNGNIVSLIYVRVNYTDDYNLKVGESFNVGINAATYYTNNTGVVDVTAQGVATVRGLGDATVFAKDISGNIISMIYVKGNYTNSLKIPVGDTINTGIKANTYYTNNENVIEVDKNGNVTGRYLGDATVFGKDANGKITSMTYVLTSYSYSMDIKVGETLEVTKKGSSYECNNTNVATVDSTGKITGMYLGDATVFVKDSNSKVISMVYVSVKYSGSKTIYLDNKYNIKEEFGLDTDKLKCYTNNEKVAKVDNANNLVPVGKGDCTLFVTDLNTSKKYMYYIKVEEYCPVEDIKLNNDNIDMSVGENDKLDVVVIPKDAKYKDVTYEEYDKNIIDVDDAGNIKAKYLGNTTIKIKSTDEKYKETLDCNVNVDYNGSIITDIKTTKNLNDYINLNDEKYKGAKIVTNNEERISVNNGIITPKSVGDASIFIYSKDNELLAMYYVMVEDYEKVTEIKVEKENITLKVGDTYKINYSVLPESAKYKDVEFLSTNNTINTVTQDGVVSSIYLGINEIKITTTNKDNLISKVITINNSYTADIFGNVGQNYDVASKLNLDKNSKYEFTTNNTNIVSVDKTSGLITLKAIGDATVFVKDSNGKMVAMVYIGVK